jgi:hypothetical protein
MRFEPKRGLLWSMAQMGVYSPARFLFLLPESPMRCLLALLSVLLAFSLPTQTRAEKRVALVIGNGSYGEGAELKNPRNDAALMATALKRLGFDVVEGHDLDKRSMERAIRQFGLKLAGTDVAFFFYAGHGLQVAGQNYLVPTDARLMSEGDVDFESVPLTLVLKQMEREAKTSIVLLDACRDNPLTRNLARAMGTRSAQIGQGLAEVKAAVGTLIGFSTQPGNVAIDGKGPNSPYAEALLTHIETPGKDIGAILIAVRNDVLKATGGRQVPWEHTSLTGQVFLKSDSAPPSTGAFPAPPPTSAPDYDKEIEIAFWNSVKDSKSPALLESYLERYPAGAFASLARLKLQELKGETKPKAEPASKEAPPEALAKPPKPAKPKPTRAARPTERESARGRAKSEAEPPTSKGMCWADVGGRTATLVPCSDPRAGSRAY